MTDIELLQSKNRKSALKTLNRLGDLATPAEPELEAAIIALTSSDDDAIRSTAIWCLGCRGNDVDLCKAALIARVPGRSDDETASLCRAIAALAPGFQKEFAIFQQFTLTCLTHPSAEVRKWALDAADVLGLSTSNADVVDPVRAEIQSSVQQAWEKVFSRSS